MKPLYAFPQFESFVWFVRERHRIYEKRAAMKPRPWTKDPILATYKFCNVYRELDRVTRWISLHWRGPHIREEHLWFAMVIARLVNRPETLAHMPFPGRWNRRAFVSTLHDRKAQGEKAFGGAYIVSTGGKAMNKAEYLAEYVLDPMWRARDVIKPRAGDSLYQFYSRLRAYDGMGSFMAAQVVADMKYVDPLASARDWWTFAASGPGSRRGMHYVMGKTPRDAKRWKEEEWKAALDELQTLMRPCLKAAGMPRMHNQDLQNCLCEFSKWSRTKAGTGRPKSKFTPFVEV